MSLQKRRFDSYFEGYAPTTVIDGEGRARTKYVYIMEYYSPRLGSGAYLARKLLNAVLFAAAAALTVWGDLDTPLYARGIALVIFQALGLVTLIVTACYIIGYISYSGKLEIKQYKNANERMPAACGAGIIMSLGTLICMLIPVLNTEGSLGADRIFILARYLIAAVCFFIIFFLEKRTGYDTLPPDPRE